jgi:hypothetical protein
MPRGGSAPGERRGGRQPGTPNKHPAEIKAVAAQHGPAIITKLAELAGVVPGSVAESQAVQVQAMKELLDRGFGRPTQPVSGDAGGPPVAFEFVWGAATPRPMTERETIEEDTGSGFVVSFATEQPC